MNTVTVQPTGVSAADVAAVARGDATVELSPGAVAAMSTSRAIVDAIEQGGRPVYGRRHIVNGLEDFGLHARTLLLVLVARREETVRQRT